jgi:ATP-dependent helicase/nuclease subunit A
VSAAAPAAPAAPADGPARAAAVTTFDRNLCVTAGAGSGKTSLLIERLLVALLDRDLPIERLVAITFTEKAAAQMRERLRLALDAIADAPEDAKPAGAGEAARAFERLVSAGVPLERLRARARAARDGDDAISTIHSFALRLLQRHPIEAGIPAGIAVDASDGFRRHVNDRLPARIAAALAAGSEQAGSMRRLLERIALPDLAALIEPLAWLPRSPADAEKETATEEMRLRAHLVARLRELARRMRDSRPAKATKGKLLVRFDRLTAALEETAAAFEAGAKLDVAPGFAEDARDAIDCELKAPESLKGDPATERALESAKGGQRLLRGLSECEEALARALVRTLTPLARELADSFLRAGSITPDGILARCVELLAGDPEVRRAEGAAISLLLVDEFQDTDPLQCEIVLLLAQEPEAAARAGVALRKDALFLVGDVKQSIYRFRGADLETFEEARRLVLAQGGAELSLTTSFRSLPALLAPLNSLFAAWFAQADGSGEFDPPYEALAPFRADAGRGPAVEIWSLPPKERRADQRRRDEGAALAAELARLHAEGTPWKHVVVLLRSLSSVGAYAQPLRERGIPFVLAGGRTFVQRSEVNELGCLLLSAADPEDPVACLGALRSTLLAVPDAEIHEAIVAGSRMRWRELAERAPVGGALRRATEWLAAAHEIVERESAPIAVERLVESSLLLPIAAAARDGDQRIANLRKLAALVSARCEELALPLADVVRDVLDRQESVDGDAESSLADEDVEAVRLLTIHAAKGLEFETVVVADLARENPGRADGRPGARTLRLGEGGGALAVNVPGADLRNVAEVVRLERERRHAVAESKRLFYVAITRARGRLILLNGGDRDAPWIAPLKALGYDAAHPPSDGARLADGRVLHRVVAPKAAERAPAPVDVPSIDELEAAVAATCAAVAAAGAAGPRVAQPSAAERPGREPTAAAPRAGRAAALARAVGSAAHRALARADSFGAPGDGAIEASAREAAREEGLDEAEVAHATRELLAGEPARRLLESLRGAKVIARELPLVLAREGVTWRGSADLVLEERERTIVADWKSDASDDPAELARRHRPQLEVYRDALARALELAAAPSMELLLLRHGRRLPL